MSVEVAGIPFDHRHYDPRGDVLYLTVAGYQGGWPVHGEASTEGHGIEYDESGRVMALTLIGVRWYMERDGLLQITWPDGHVTKDDLAALIQTAA
jgi:uncharacterized protein YuzE